MYSHWPWYIADDAAEIVVCALHVSTLSHTSCGPRLTLHVRSKNISPSLTTIFGLDGMSQWLGLHWLSADLTSMDCFPWDHINALIYTSPVDSEEEFIACVVEAAVTIRQQPGIFERAHQSLLRRQHTCTVHTVHIYSYRSVCLWVV